MNKLLLISLLFSRLSFAQSTCDSSQLPIVFVHGFMGSGDNWATQMQRFSSNDFCEDRLFAFDWNSIGNSKNTMALLDSFIGNILLRTKSGKINLVAHSAGGGLCYNYLNDSLRALKVSHYVHVGSMKMKGPAGINREIPTMNIFSEADKVVRSGGEIPGAVNVKQSSNDHLQVATGYESFKEMFQFFKRSDITVNTSIIPSPGTHAYISGRAVLLAENMPLSKDSFICYYIDPKTSERIKNKDKAPGNPVGRWMKFGDDGSFGININKNSFTEFEVHPADGRTLFYFFEPFERNKQIYLRALPKSGLAASMIGNIPNDENQSALVIFTSNNAVIAGRDSLAIDSIPLSVPSIMPAGKTSISCFLYDDGDQQTSGQALKALSKAPFLSGVDVYIKSSATQSMRIYYNGRNIVLPKRKSKDGIMVLVLN